MLPRTARPRILGHWAVVVTSVVASYVTVRFGQRGTFCIFAAADVAAACSSVLRTPTVLAIAVGLGASVFAGPAWASGAIPFPTRRLRVDCLS